MKLLLTIINGGYTMKAKAKSENVAEGLLRKQLRGVETKLGVYLDKPQRVSRSSNQQFGVYDEDEVFAGDILAGQNKFTEDELVEKIKELF